MSAGWDRPKGRWHWYDGSGQISCGIPTPPSDPDCRQPFLPPLQGGTVRTAGGHPVCGLCLRRHPPSSTGRHLRLIKGGLA